MFQDDFIFSLATFGVGAYLFYMWLGDCAYFSKNGEARKGAFAGAAPADFKSLLLAAGLAAFLLIMQVSGEDSMGLTSSQTKVGMFAIFAWASAAFVEELVFRGYLIVQNKGVKWLVGSAFFFSLIFALAHPFLWDYKVAEGASVLAGTWVFDFSLKSFYSTFCIFECSLLFYFLRFMPMNKNRSLLPSVVAHLTFNVGVFATKAAQGFVEWTF